MRLSEGLRLRRCWPKWLRQTSISVISLLLAASLLTPRVSAQQQEDTSKDRISDLSAQNLARVSASAAELKTILLRDGGLLVELKRWMAKDATNHGQIISDSELTNEAIFDRMEADTQFRALATSLIQHYGYLLPTMNPLSEVAKERDLLVQERTKWLAQRQEEEIAAARRQAVPGVGESTTCDAAAAGCDVSATRRRNPSQTLQPGEVPAGSIGGLSEPPNLSGAQQNRLLRARNVQSDDDLMPDGVSLPFPDFYGSISSLDRDGQYRLSSVESRDNSFDTTASAPLADANTPVGSQGAKGLMSGAVGNEAGSIPLGGLFSDATAMNRQTSDRFPDHANPPRSSRQSPYRGSTSELAPQPSDLVRKPGPYEYVPSLYDMYVQAVAHPATPRRFGAEVFKNGTRDSQLIPMDLPVGPDYVVGPGDGLTVDLWGSVSQRLYRTVDHEGRVSLPEVGPIEVSGKSLSAVQAALQQTLRTQFRDVSADVSLARLRTIRVYAVGDVTNPGAYDISSLSTPLNALFAADGPTTRGSMRILKHFRGTQLIQTVDVYDLLLHGVKTDLQRLENGDTIQVPPMGAQVTVEGMVRRPAIYELRDEKTLANTIELAGGLLPAAALRHIEVERTVEHEKQTMVSLEISETDTTADAAKKLEAFEIHDGDRIRIYPIAPYNQDSVYLEGHVVRPGRYSFHADMRLTDVISTYKDLLPEPASQYAEIIRLNAPDFRPSVEGFDLANALADPQHAPQLHAMDTIRIYSRFDFENPPTVSVMGDVRAPGTYRTSGEVRLSDAIHLAEGLAPDAQTADAQVFRYLPDGKFKIFSVSLERALSGDPTENILLQPRDRLLIHKSPDAVEPATVYVQGEVGKPGRYPLTTNMHVADLIRIGGGIKPSADTLAADLTRFQWPTQSKLMGQQQEINLSAALGNDSGANVTLHNGDVLTIRQLPGWNDLGASITLKGEVKHPGTYGIRPGEHLSSVIERAGGFQPDAYPYAAVLQRPQVREIESKAQAEILERLRDAETSLQLLPETDGKQKEAKAVALQQAQSSVEQVSASPVVGRVNIRIVSQISRWKGTPADVEVRAGDTLTVPKRPSYVMVTGQVFNPTAVSFRPGKSAKWYLSQSGGPTQMGNRKEIFVIRADGSVISSRGGLLSGDSMSASLQAGDTVMVPEKAIAGGLPWQSVLFSAQAVSAIASTVFIALRY